MASTAREGSVGDLIYHTTAVRLRVVGTGVLRPTLKSLDDVRTQTLATINMATAPGRLANVLANFMEQRTTLELKTTAIDEYMKVNRIIIWVKPVFTGYPQ